MTLTDAEDLANFLIKEHQLHWVGWSFAFDRATVRFGATHHSLRRITLSKALTEVNDEQTVRTTLLHEIAHALCGHGHGHDKTWKEMCRIIGGDGKARYNSMSVNMPSRSKNTKSK